MHLSAHALSLNTYARARNSLPFSPIHVILLKGCLLDHQLLFTPGDSFVGYTDNTRVRRYRVVVDAVYAPYFAGLSRNHVVVDVAHAPYFAGLC